MAELVVSVQQVITALDLGERDRAVADLALTYAQAIDDNPDQLEPLGPKLLTALEALGASPRARAQLAKGGDRASGPSPLDELRDRRAARQRDAAAVDAPAP